ncbi:hypothetical protein EBM89_04385 [Cellulomonas triticagri]|uniref:Uncharacterized protein n=1 Tax=Cellulomonas triticagri TaxID=2483352 RepID=A0A3M2JT98_9CELL|nr:hypothetical protein EBM89_04385 [Cellulomonas triticagri]
MLGVTVLGVVALAACSAPGDLEISNTGPEDVVVVVDGQEHDVTGDGGVLLLENGCTDGDVVVRRASGVETVLPGPVCPPDRVLVGETVAEVRPPSGT